MNCKNIKSSRTIKMMLVLAIIAFCGVPANASILPPDPNNAALLYYQAFLCQPEPDYAEEQLVYKNRAEKIYDFLCGGKIEFDTDIEEEIQELEKRLNNDANEPDEIPSELKAMLPEIKAMMPEGAFRYDIQYRLSELRELHEHQQKMRGVDPNETIRNYMKKCRDAIELTEAASELTDCDWGTRYSRPDGPTVTPLAKIRRFAFMLRADALLHAANGDYKMAFERCLMIRRFARHFGDDTQLQYIMSITIDRMALHNIKIILGCFKPEVETLTWLKSQLTIERNSGLSLTKVLNRDFELFLQALRNSNKMLDPALKAMRLKNEIIASYKEKRTPNIEASKEVQSVTGEELVALAREPYANFLNSVIQVINGGMSYQEKLSKINSLTEKIENKFGGDPNSFPILAAHPEKMLTFSIVIHCADVGSALYELSVNHLASYNIIIAGIEVYLIRAQTGKLPEKLPEGVPKDPYTGNNFKYEITEDGFKLSLPDKDLQKKKFRLHEFKVKK